MAAGPPDASSDHADEQSAVKSNGRCCLSSPLNQMSCGSWTRMGFRFQALKRGTQMFKRSWRILLPMLALVALALAGCATQPHPSSGHLPGFFSGVLHGFLMPFSLIASFF